MNLREVFLYSVTKSTFTRQDYRDLTFSLLNLVVTSQLGTHLSSLIFDRHKPPPRRSQTSLPARRVCHSVARHGQLLQPGGTALFPELHRIH